MMTFLNGFGQVPLGITTTPNGMFDNVYDRIGNHNNIEDLKIDTSELLPGISSRPILLSCGTNSIFNLWFDDNSGMQGSSTIEIQRRAVICQVFQDVSNIINTPLKTRINPTTGFVDRVNIWVMNSPTDPVILGQASDFYNTPQTPTVINGGIIDGKVWKTLHTGRNSWENIAVTKITGNIRPFCSFTTTLSISCATNMVVTLVDPSGKTIANPSSFALTAGNHDYVVTLIPNGGFTGGLLHVSLNGILPSQEPCTFAFDIETPRCGGHRPSGKTSADNELEKQPTIVIAPNPAHEKVTISYTNLMANSTISLYDLTGRNLNNYSNDVINGKLEITTSQYPAGVYLVVVKEHDQIISQQKLIINK